MNEQKIDERIINKDPNQSEGVNRYTFLKFLVGISNEEYDLSFIFIKRDCDRDKLSKSK